MIRLGSYGAVTRPGASRLAPGNSFAPREVGLERVGVRGLRPHCVTLSAEMRSDSTNLNRKTRLPEALSPTGSDIITRVLRTINNFNSLPLKRLSAFDLESI